MSADIDTRLRLLEQAVRDHANQVGVLEKQTFRLENAIFQITVGTQTKRFKPVPSYGVVELRLPNGKKLYRMMFEEVGV